jgi:hypothetical protein
MSQFVLDAAKRAQAAGAVAVVVPVPRNADGSVTLDVFRIPLPDVFDESTGLHLCVCVCACACV